MRASGAGAPGTIDADVKVQLVPAAGGGTELTYDADASVGGAIGGVGQRMLTGVTKKMAGQFFTALDRDIAGLPPVGASWREPRRERTATAPASGAVFPGRAATANASLSLDNGAGFAVGVLVGGLSPWPASRSGRRSGGGADARLHRGRRPGRPGPGAAHRRVRRRPTSTSSSTSPAGASRRPVPSSSSCPSPRRPASRQGARPSSCGSSCPSCPARSSSRCATSRPSSASTSWPGRTSAGRRRTSSTTPRCSSTRPGELLGVYRKTHPFCTEAVSGGGWVTPGDTVTVCDTELGRIGMMICFDGDYPELARIQAVQGAEVICRPSALLRSADIWELTSRARAYDNHVYVVGANAVGSDPAGVLYFGNSHIVTPIGHIVAKAATHEGWVSATARPRGGPVVPDARLQHHPGLRPPAGPQPPSHPQPPGRARGPGDDVLPARLTVSRTRCHAPTRPAT